MTINRIRNWSDPGRIRGMPAVEEYLQQHYEDHVNESRERIQDFDVLQLSNIGWEDARAWGVSIDSGNNQTALDAALTDIQSTGKALFLPAGTYLTEKITAFTNGMRFYGSGMRDTILQSKSGDDVIEITGKSLHTLKLENFGIQGYGSGSGHGIHIHSNTFPPFSLDFRNLHITDCGAKGLYIPEEFSSNFTLMEIDNCGGNALEVQGGNTTTFQNIYTHHIASGMCGFRILNGRPVLINCNGIDSDATWGIFGQTTGEDGVETYSFPTFIDCNVEGFGSVGVRMKYGSSLNIFSTKFNPTSGTVTAILFDFIISGKSGILDAMSSFSLGGTASWADGKAIHTNGGGCPFISYNDSIVGFYRDDNSLTYTMPHLSTAYSSYLNYSLDISRGYFDKVDFIVGNDFRTFTANDGTPSVDNYNNFKTANTGATTITMFDDGVNGQPIKVIIGDANTTIDFTATNLRGNAGVDWTPGSGDWLEAIFDGANWYCSIHDCTA